MESQRINILLQRYFDAKTTDDEENELINYFVSDRVEEDLKKYKTLFSGLNKLSTDKNRDLSNDLMNHILESEHREKLRYRLKMRIITAVAASVIMGLLAVNFYSHPKPNKVIINDPKEAYEEVAKAFKYLTGKYDEGIAELAPLKKIDDATDLLQSGIRTINDGFNETKEIKRINNEFKNN